MRRGTSDSFYFISRSATLSWAGFAIQVICRPCFPKCWTVCVAWSLVSPHCSMPPDLICRKPPSMSHALRLALLEPQGAVFPGFNPLQRSLGYHLAPEAPFFWRMPTGTHFWESWACLGNSPAPALFLGACTTNTILFHITKNHIAYCLVSR